MRSRSIPGSRRPNEVRSSIERPAIGRGGFRARRERGWRGNVSDWDPGGRARDGLRWGGGPRSGKFTPLPAMRRLRTRGAAVMPPLDPVVVEVEPFGESDPQPDRHLPPCWPPRPATVVAALFVGSSLVFINLIDADFARNLSELYGWPFRFHFSAPDPPRSSGGFYLAALAADLVISAALLVSACVTTQVAACLLVRSPRLDGPDPRSRGRRGRDVPGGMPVEGGLPGVFPLYWLLLQRGQPRRAGHLRTPSPGTANLRGPAAGGVKVFPRLRAARRRPA